MRTRTVSATAPPPAISPTCQDEGLYRGLSRWHALAIVVGAVVGTGIYIRPVVIAQLLHAPGPIMLVWILAGMLSLAGALCYAELAARVPRWRNRDFSTPPPLR